MPKPRQFFEAFTEDMFYFNLLTMPFAFVLAVMSGGISTPLKIFLFLPIILYHYFIRIFVRKFTPFLFLTWAACLVGTITKNYIVNTVFIVFLCSHSVRIRTNEGAKLRITFETLAFPLIFLTVLYIAADYFGIPEMRFFFYCQAIAIFILSILYTHLCGINRELEFTAKDSLQPTGEITNFVNKYLSVYILGFFVVLALFRYVPFGKIAAAAGRLAVRIIRSLLGSADKDEYYKMGLDGYGTGAETIPFDTEIPKLPLWLRILETAAVYIVNIAVLLLLVILVVMFFLRLYYGFYGRKERKITYLNGTSEVTALPPQKKKSKKINISDPIRRKFYKKVKKYLAGNIVSSADTPFEMRDKLKDREDMTLLAEQYEDVRYASEK